MSARPELQFYRDATFTRLQRYTLDLIARHLSRELSEVTGATAVARSRRRFLTSAVETLTHIGERWDANEATEIVEVPA